MGGERCRRRSHHPVSATLTELFPVSGRIDPLDAGCFGVSAVFQLKFDVVLRDRRLVRQLLGARALQRFEDIAACGLLW